MPKPEKINPASTAVENDLQQQVLDVVDQWLREVIHGSPVARNTEAYNHLVDSLPDLKARLAAIITE